MEKVRAGIPPPSGDPNNSGFGLSTPIDGEGVEKIKKFLNEVNEELSKLFSEQYIRDYIREDSQDLFIQYSNDLKDVIARRTREAKEALDIPSMWGIDLEKVGWTGIERDFKLGVWGRIKGRVGAGWDWLTSKLDIINTFLGSLSNAGVPGVDALSEIKDAYEAAKK